MPCTRLGYPVGRNEWQDVNRASYPYPNEEEDEKPKSDQVWHIFAHPFHVV